MPGPKASAEQPSCPREGLLTEMRLGSIFDRNTGPAEIAGGSIGNKDRADDRGISFQDQAAAIPDQKENTVKSI